jgi:predicted metal-dependent peptidase
MSQLPKHLEDKVVKARFSLYEHFPFFAQLAQYFKPIAAPGHGSAAITANAELFLDPEFVEKCNENDMLWVLCHEAFHIVTMTSSRTPEGADRLVWNIASDAVINPILDEAGLPLIRPEVIVPIREGKFAKYKGSTTEAAYFDMMQNPEKTFGMSLKKLHEIYDGGDGGSGKGGGKGAMKEYWWDNSGSELGKKGNTKGMDKDGNSQSNGGMTEEQRAQWKDRIASAAEAAKNAGKLPGVLGAFVTTLLAPKKDWKKELRVCVRSILTNEWTFKKPSRRTIGIGIRTPGVCGEKPTCIGSIDTSGSMSKEELTRCLSEFKKIVELCGGKSYLILHDAEVYWAGEVTDKELSQLRELQQGGTDFCCIFDHIKEELDKVPALLVGFTDCCGPFPAKQPNFPVIWCRPNSGYKGEPPWGKLIEVDL